MLQASVASLELEIIFVIKEERSEWCLRVRPVCCNTIGWGSPGSQREQGLLGRAELSVQCDL